MNKKIFVTDLIQKKSSKELVDDIFFIKHFAMVDGRDGRTYINCILCDATGEIEGRIWAKVHDISKRIDKGQYVQVIGKTNLYQGRPQIVIQDIFEISKDEINEEDFIIKGDVNADALWDELLQSVGYLSDVYIKKLLMNVLEDEIVKARLLEWPAGKSIHHAYKSGLLEHIVSCVRIAMFLSNHYKVNSNYVIAGMILHDIGKIYELTYDVLADYSDEGKLVGHMAKALEMIDCYSVNIEGFPQIIKQHLKHIILAHHGSYEYGSPKLPQTQEAMLVHLIDFLDSKMNAFSTIIKTDNSTGDWSGFVKHLDRVIYKKELPTFESIF